MKNLYKSLSILTLVFAAHSVMGQFYISPNPNITSDFEYSESDVIGHGFVTNEGSQTLQLTWERTEVELPEGWESAVCDNVQCYLTFVSSKEFTLTDSEEGTMDVHVYPDGSAGSAIIKILVYETANPSVADSALYYFDKTLSVPERLSNALKIYPNPVTDVLSIENAQEVASLEVFDMNGRLVKRFSGNNPNGMSVADLNAGNYLVRMYNADHLQISTNLLVKVDH